MKMPKKHVDILLSMLFFLLLTGFAFAQEGRVAIKGKTEKPGESSVVLENFNRTLAGQFTVQCAGWGDQSSYISPRLDKKVKKEGESSLRLDYRLNKQWDGQEIRFISRNPAYQDWSGSDQLTFWIKGTAEDKAAVQIRVYDDSGTKRWNYTFKANHDQWRKIKINFSDEKPGFTKDGKKDPGRIRFFSIVLVNWSNKPIEGTIWVDDIRRGKKTYTANHIRRAQNVL